MLTIPFVDPLPTLNCPPTSALLIPPAVNPIITVSPVSAFENHDASTALPPSHMSPQITNSALKPLASFFDQFLQTARAETQLERTKRNKAPRKTSQHPNQGNAPKPIGTLKSFLRNTVRQTSSARRPAHLPDSNYRFSPPYSPNALTNHVPSFDVPSSMTTQFRVPPSPDAHRVFQLTPYQVVLPSTPPTASRPMLYPTDGDDHDFPIDAVDSSVNLFCFNARVCKFCLALLLHSISMLPPQE
jgi:hypothetical protein